MKSYEKLRTIVLNRWEPEQRALRFLAVATEDVEGVDTKAG